MERWINYLRFQEHGKGFKKGIQAGIQAYKERDLLITEFKKLQKLHTKQVKKLEKLGVSM